MAAILIKDPADDDRETIRLIYFDGSNSMRQVKDVVRIGLKNESDRDRE